MCQFTKIVVRSSPDPAKIGFSPIQSDPVLIRAHLCWSARGNIGGSHIHFPAVDRFWTKELDLQVVDLGKD